MSAGINDLAFGPLITYCISTVGTCQTHKVQPNLGPHASVTSYTWVPFLGETLAAITAEKLKILEFGDGHMSGFARLALPLAEMHAAHVFISEYPETAYDENGLICTGTGRRTPRFYQSTWSWLAATGSALNAAIASTTQFGWTPITGIAKDFKLHGYCAANSFFVPLREALVYPNKPGLIVYPDLPSPVHFTSEGKSGAFHPTIEGQMITYNHTLEGVCKALYGNATCS